MNYDLNLKILVVDDARSMRRIIEHMLKGIGFTNIFQVEDGKEAQDAITDAHLQEAPFDLIISDWNMPNMNGLELVKYLKSDKRFDNIPFLLITAEAELSNITLAVKHGVSNFIIKPFDITVFKEKLQTIYPDSAPSQCG